MPAEVPTVSSSGERCASIQAQVHPWAHCAQRPTRACSPMLQGRVCTLKPLEPLALRPRRDSAGALSNTQVTAPPSTERKSLSWDLSSQPTQAGHGARHVCRGLRGKEEIWAPPRHPGLSTGDARLPLLPPPAIASHHLPNKALTLESLPGICFWGSHLIKAWLLLLSNIPQTPESTILSSPPPMLLLLCCAPQPWIQPRWEANRPGDQHLPVCLTCLSCGNVQIQATPGFAPSFGPALELVSSRWSF